MDFIEINTAQNVKIKFDLASIGDRLAAYLIDIGVLVLYSMVMGTFLVVTQNFLDVFAPWMRLALVSLPILLYPLILEIIFNGQTIGKMAKGIRVVMEDGSQPTLGAYLLRWVMIPLDITLSLGSIGIMSMAASGTGQRLGDLAAGTTVIKAGQLKYRLNLPTLEEDYQPTFREVAQLSDRQVALLKQTIERYRASKNPKPVRFLADRLKAYLKLETELPALQLLYTLLKDYQHLTHGDALTRPKAS